MQWFYDPMAVTAFAGHMEEIAVVYDCMDELSKFRYAPPVLVQRERDLLAEANPAWSLAMVGPACKVDPAERRR